MPVSFRIYPQHNLAHAMFEGEVTLSEAIDGFQAYTRHPDFQAAQSQIVDLTRVTGYERDFTRIMELQALQAEYFLGGNSKPFLIFVAPDELTQSMAMAALRSWSSVDGIVPLIVSELAGALDVLGLGANSLAVTQSKPA